MQSNTTIFHLVVQQVYNYMLCWPSSGCDLTYRAAIQDVWGVLLGYWVLGWGERDLVVSIVVTMT